MYDAHRPGPERQSEGRFGPIECFLFVMTGAFGLLTLSDYGEGNRTAAFMGSVCSLKLLDDRMRR